MDDIRVAGLTDDEQREFSHLYGVLDKKRGRNKIRSAYYEMKNMTRLVGSVIPQNYWNLGIVMGWSAKAVDILARRCNLDSFVWPDGDLESIGYREIWEDNNLASEVNQGMVSSLIHSTAFVVGTVGDETMGEPAAQIHFRDALSATGDWNSRTRCLDNLLSVHEWEDDLRPLAFTLYRYNQTIDARKVRGVWSVNRQDHTWGVPAEPMPYKPRLGRPFGSSRISRAVMSLQDQATRTVIRLEAHSDIYAIPDLWLLGADASIFRNTDGSQKAMWQVMMGRLKAIPDDEDVVDPSLARADVKQFAASDPDPHLKALRQQAQLFSGETSIPLSSLGVSDQANPTSADSYIASREDLISEAEGATDDWGPALRRAMVRALAMTAGLAIDNVPPEWKTIAPRWRSPVHLSRAAAADAGTKQLTAVPWLAETEVGLELLGLDSQQILRAQSDRRRAIGRQSLGVIANVAAAAAAAKAAAVPVPVPAPVGP